MIKLEIEVEEQLQDQIRAHRARKGLRYALLLPSLLVHFGLGCHRLDGWCGDATDILQLLLKGHHSNIIKQFSECTAELNSLRGMLEQTEVVRSLITKRCFPKNFELYEVTCNFFRAEEDEPFHSWQVMIEISGVLNSGVRASTKADYFTG